MPLSCLVLHQNKSVSDERRSHQVADNKLGGTVVASRDWSAIEKCLHRLEEEDDCTPKACKGE